LVAGTNGADLDGQPKIKLMPKGRKPSRFLIAIVALILGQSTIVLADGPGAVNSPAAFAVKVTGTGRPMILIPGLSCGGDVWDGTVAHFKDRYECHVLTLAGFAGQPTINGPLLEQVREGLEKYIREKKLDHPVIIGHSLGGFMAFWVGATIPQKVGPIIAVDGVPFLPGLFNSNATPASAKNYAEQSRAMYDTQTPQQFMELNRNALISMITDPANVEAVNTTSKKSDAKAVGEAFYELMTIDLRQRIKAIQTPVLLIGASAAIPEALQRTMVEDGFRQEVAAIPNHQVIFAPHARHFIQLDEPRFFYEQVESFLKASDRPGAK
jgi:pimeloyl-ACP methyl ester carboxylesterase